MSLGISEGPCVCVIKRGEGSQVYLPGCVKDREFDTCNALRKERELACQTRKGRRFCLLSLVFPCFKFIPLFYTNTN